MLEATIPGSSMTTVELLLIRACVGLISGSSLILIPTKIWTTSRHIGLPKDTLMPNFQKQLLCAWNGKLIELLYPGLGNTSLGRPGTTTRFGVPSSMDASTLKLSSSQAVHSPKDHLELSYPMATNFYFTLRLKSNLPSGLWTLLNHLIPLISMRL